MTEIINDTHIQMTEEFYQTLKNENQVFKYKNKNDNFNSLTKDYLFFLKKVEED
jgi:hypothetical protein